MMQWDCAIYSNDLIRAMQLEITDKHRIYHIETDPLGMVIDIDDLHLEFLNTLRVEAKNYKKRSY